MGRETVIRARRARAGCALALALSLATPLPAAPPAEPAKPSFPAQAEVVTVDVVVTDRRGEPVLDLRREDFTVSEDAWGRRWSRSTRCSGRPRRRPPWPPPARRPRCRGPPRTSEPLARAASQFVIVFDELHLTLAEAVRARKAVTEFLATGAAGGDRVALVGTAEGTRWTARMPEGRETLTRALVASAASASSTRPCATG